MTLDKNILQKLSFAKYLYTLAVEQSSKPDPLCSVAILHLHDSMDVILQLAFDELKLHRAKQNLYLEDYAKAINDELVKNNKTTLPLSLITKLNGLRNPIKHHTFFVAPSTVVQLVAEVGVTLREVALCIFDTQFDEVSLVHMIAHDEIKELLELAISCFANGDEQDAYVNMYIAFQKIEEHQDMVGSAWKNRGQLDRDFDKIDLENEVRPALKTMQAIIEELSGVISLLRADIKISDYNKYWETMPNVGLSQNRTVTRFYYKKKNQTKDDFDFCLNFLIEYSLKI